MKNLIDESIKAYIKKAFNNRRIHVESGENVPALIRSVDDGFTPIKFPTHTEGASAERIFDLPEIPYRAEQGSKPILLFRGKFPEDKNGNPITDFSALSVSANRLQEGVDYVLSGSRERPTAVKLVNPGTEWTYTDDAGKTHYYDINFWFYGLGTVLTAFDFENFSSTNVKTEVAEIERLATEELNADNVNIADLIRVIGKACEVRDTTEIGIIKMWGGTELPKNLDGSTNYLLCDGRLIGKSSYPELFKAWGVTASTMKLPDFTGRTPVGAGEFEDGWGEQTFELLGEGGSRRHKITIDEMPSHTHNVRFGRKDLFVDNNGSSFVTTGTSGLDRGSDAAGGSQSMSLMQPYIGVKFIVRYR